MNHVSMVTIILLQLQSVIAGITQCNARSLLVSVLLAARTLQENPHQAMVLEPSFPTACTHRNLVKT
uniref:Secreted protein n=1 Tax=Anguilla anguilla TaxID=7936 RepID=A0A0E9T7S7_ANGAN